MEEITNDVVPMDDESLDLFAAEVARKELREDQHTREQALEQFRNWVLQNPDIVNCRTDDSFLLCFLRFKKFSISMAQQTLINYLRLQQKFPQIVNNMDVKDPTFNSMMSSGYLYVSPFRSSNGSRVIVNVPRKLDMQQFDYPMAMKVFPATMYTLLEDKHTQIFGVTYVLDFERVPPAYLTFFPPNVLLSHVKNLEKQVPVRQKAIHLINLPSLAVWFVNLFKSALSEKMQKRIHIHGSLDELHGRIDPGVLPREYGGKMPEAEMIELWNKELMSRRDKVVSVNNIRLQGESLKDNSEASENGISQLPGSFRKLDVD